MYSVVKGIIDHVWETGSQASGDQQYIYYTCCCLIIILTVVFIDLIYRIFRNLWR